MSNNFLAFLLLLVSFKLGSAQINTQAVVTIIQACAALQQIDMKDLPRLAAASEDKVSENYKCFIKCELEAFGLLNMGKLDTSKLIYNADPKVNIVIDCDKAVQHKGYDAENDCDYGYKLGRCIFEGLNGHLKQQKSQRASMKASCASLTGFQLSEHEKLKANGYQNAERSFKCFVNCVYEQANILQSGSLNRALFEEQHNGNALYNRVKQCHVDIYEKGFQANAVECEFAYQLLLCLENSKTADQEDDF